MSENRTGDFLTHTVYKKHQRTLYNATKKITYGGQKVINSRLKSSHIE